MRFEALLRAHGFMKTERPPETWEAETDDIRFVPLLGEMIAAGISGGSALADLTLNVSNVVVELEGKHGGLPASTEACPTWTGDSFLPSGEFVAVTVRGRTDLGPDHVWRPGLAPATSMLLGRLDDRLVEAGAVYAYVRRIPPAGSVTVFLNRRV